MNKWNTIAIPEINPYTYYQLIFNKEAKNTESGKYGFFNSCCFEN